MSASSSPPPRREPRFRRWGFFAIAVLVGLACIRLGFWQLDRLAERRAVNATIRAELERPEVSLPEDLGRVPRLEHRRAVARGVFDSSQEVYLTSRAQGGIPGVHVVTPLRLADGGPALLVDRGWISDTDYRGLASETWAVGGPTEVRGLLFPSQPEPSIAFLADRIPAAGEPPLHEWRALSIEGIRRQVPYPVLDVYLAQQSPALEPGAPQPSAELDLGEGPHLGYAIQWFAFAAIALGGGAIWMLRSSKPRS